MPAFVEIEFEDPTQNQNTLVFPGACMRVCAEGADGFLSGFVTIACDTSDKAVDVFEELNPTEKLSHVTSEEIEKDLKPENLTASLGHDEHATFYLRDSDYGLLQIVVRHSVLLSSN